MVGRESCQVRLRVVMDTKATTLEKHVHQFSLSDCHVYTDEYDSYNGIERERSTVAHGIKEWARDDDDDGIRECHTNTRRRYVDRFTQLPASLSRHAQEVPFWLCRGS